MNLDEIITHIGTCEDYAVLDEIAAALEARRGTLRLAFMAQAEAMGIACKDRNGRKPRKPRANKHNDQDESA
jgi:hypothetical protein